jgi:hypothetical protein
MLPGDIALPDYSRKHGSSVHPNPPYLRSTRSTRNASRKALLHVQRPSVSLYRRFPLQIPDCYRYTLLHGDVLSHLYKVSHCMSFIQSFYRGNGIAFSRLTGRADGLLNSLIRVVNTRFSTPSRDQLSEHEGDDLTHLVVC